MYLYYTSTCKLDCKKVVLVLFSGISKNTVIKMQYELKLGRGEKSLSSCDLFSLFQMKKKSKGTHTHTHTHSDFQVLGQTNQSFKKEWTLIFMIPGLTVIIEADPLLTTFATPLLPNKGRKERKCSAFWRGRNFF